MPTGASILLSKTPYPGRGKVLLGKLPSRYSWSFLGFSEVSRCMQMGASSSCPWTSYPSSMAFQETTFPDGILLNSLQATSMLTLSINVNQAIPPKQSDLQLLSAICSLAHLVSSPALNCTGTRIQHHSKCNKVCQEHTFYCIWQNSFRALELPFIPVGSICIYDNNHQTATIDDNTLHN